MASASMKPQGHGGLEPLDVDPFYLINRDHLFNRSQEPFDLHTQANTNYLTVNANNPRAPSKPMPIPTMPAKWIDALFVDIPWMELNHEVDINRYRPLYQAALNGDWECASRFIECDGCAWSVKVSMQSMTALHVVIASGCFQFAKKLVEKMCADELAIKDSIGCTAFHYAAAAGSTKLAKAMVKKNPALTQITNEVEITRLFTVAAWGRKEVLWYLSSVARDGPPSSPFTGPSACLLFNMVVTAGFQDIALNLLQQYPNLPTVVCDNNERIVLEMRTVLDILASEPSAFVDEGRLGFWKSRVYSLVPVELNYASPNLLRGNVEDAITNTGDLAQVSTSIISRTSLNQVLQWFNRLLWKAFAQLVPAIKQVCDEKLKHKQTVELIKHACIQVSRMDNLQIVEFFKKRAILHTATKNGIVKIVIECLHFFPDLINLPIKEQTILHVAVEYRQEAIFNLLRKKNVRLREMTLYLMKSNDTILHLAGKLPPSSKLKSISGSAFQIQRELQWFKEVEKIIFPLYKNAQNNNKKTAWEVFMEEHKELVESGEKWMKETSNSCMLVATLIATVVFAAAFTVPEGNTNDNGIPIFLNHSFCILFAISDALALFSSCTSLLIFLSILTSRYAEEDFLQSLPKRLINGLASLFFAIVTMMIAFTATLSIVLGEKWKWACIPIAIGACFPVNLFAIHQLPLFIQIIQSTYGFGIFGQQSNLML